MNPNVVVLAIVMAVGCAIVGAGVLASLRRGPVVPITKDRVRGSNGPKAFDAMQQLAESLGRRYYDVKDLPLQLVGGETVRETARRDWTLTEVVLVAVTSANKPVVAVSYLEFVPGSFSLQVFDKRFDQATVVKEFKTILKLNA